MGRDGSKGIRIGANYHLPPKPLADLVPDMMPLPPVFNQPPVATFSQAWPWALPVPAKDFYKLPPDMQKLLLEQYRYGAIRCRADIKDRTIPINRQLIDIP